tara:strand:+ start:282 stop:899 length:618 start_codon:yes stop_codon:yes gene_type:complete
MSKCTKNALELFGNDHYTYINQIFGDETVRQIIKESYAPRDWNFVVIPGEGDFLGSDHHVLEKKGKNGEIIQWCSEDEGFQKTKINKNDTLCQSYSLLKYLNKPIDKNMKERQMEMIKMYRNILSRDHFKKEFKKVYNQMKQLIKKTKIDNHPGIWIDYTYEEPEPYLNKEFNALYAEIHNTLDTWENYGYSYFIKKGKTCPKKK